MSKPLSHEAFLQQMFEYEPASQSSQDGFHIIPLQADMLQGPVSLLSGSENSRYGPLENPDAEDGVLLMTPSRPSPDGTVKSSRNRETKPDVSTNNASRFFLPFATLTDHLSGWWQKRWLRIWWWEAVCCCLIVAALVGIIVTIRNYDSKPLHQWPYGISINVFIAAYSVVIKSAAGLVLAEGISHLKWTNLRKPSSLHSFAVHDGASRGPWGAILLLRRDKGRNISSLGAFVMILVLLLEPFSQQIVRFYNCSQQSLDTIPTIPRSNIFWEPGLHVGANLESIPFSVRNAWFQGLFASTQPEVAANCPSGKCTFSGQYTSVAYCSSCKDITPDLVQTTFSNKTQNYINVTLPGHEEYALTREVPRGTSYANPSLISWASDGINMIRWFKPSPLMINETWAEHYKGYSCSFWPCMKTFSAEVVAGKLRERVESASGANYSEFFEYLSGSVVTTADLDCLDSDAKGKLRDIGYNFNETTRWLAYDVSLLKDNSLVSDYSVVLGASYGNCSRVKDNLRSKYCHLEEGLYKPNRETAEIIPTQCIYTISSATMASIEAYLLAQMFEGTLLENPSYPYEAFSGPAPLMAVWNAGSGNGTMEDINGIMQNISTAFTTHMRLKDYSNFPAAPATGEMFYNTTCIRVRWGWFIYSAITVGLTLAFFVTMLVQSRIDQSRLRRVSKDGDALPPRHDFKSDALTLLYHGLDQESLKAEALGTSNREKELQERAKRLNVRMVATEQGWKLSTQEK